MLYEGTPGNDFITGAAEDDRILGGDGADMLAGEAGRDSIDGEAGSDTLFGGIGVDLLVGGTGDDVLLGANGNDTLDGGAQDWNDIADYYEAPFAIVIDLAQGVATLDGFGDTDTLVSIEGVYGSWFDDRITGDAGTNFLWGAPGNDTMHGGAGNDVLEGADGRDLANFGGSALSYTITTDARSGQMTVAGPDGVDLMNSIERVSFTDRQLAFDLDGNAGTGARILGAVAGADWIGARGSEYLGAGLALLDGGASPAALMQLALEARLGSNAANHGAVVDLLYNNIMRAPPDAAAHDYFVALLDSQTYSVIGLAMAASESTYNDENIGLAGLALTGLEYA